MSRSSPPPSPTVARGPGSEAAAPRPAKRRHFKHHLAATMRWLHIYLSMFGLATILFFGATGLTLNHPTWTFGVAEKMTQAQGQVDLKWLNPDAPAATPDGERPVMKLEVVEHLRKEHGVRGALAEFRSDDRERMVTFKGPGYSADAFIDRETGKYNLTESRHGFVAMINDLHKGRDTGAAWSVVVDV